MYTKSKKLKQKAAKVQINTYEVTLEQVEKFKHVGVAFASDKKLNEEIDT